MARKKRAIKVYHGFGHTHDIVLYGHVFRKHAPTYLRQSGHSLTNLFRLLKLFFIQPVGGVPLQVKWDEQLIDAHTEYDGFFKAEWTSTRETTAGWHDVNVREQDGNSTSKGEIYIPHRTQFIFVSDIDDTIMVSHSATVWKRLKELLFKSAHSRSLFPDVVKHYQLLANAHTEADQPNPFFYVSSSEWNLYDYLRDTFLFNKLPDGTFLLSQLKRWYQLFKTGKTKHEGKLLRILRLMEVFPNQRFVLFGDNSQSDPAIYATLAEKYAHRMHAVYIRNVRPVNGDRTNEYLSAMKAKNIHTLQFTHSSEAITHSKQIGLITARYEMREA
jgi:phosphatidate phosphatase APP1